jgi:hypothetical protein
MKTLNICLPNSTDTCSGAMAGHHHLLCVVATVVVAILGLLNLHGHRELGNHQPRSLVIDLLHQLGEPRVARHYSGGVLPQLDTRVGTAEVHTGHGGVEVGDARDVGLVSALK